MLEGIGLLRGIMAKMDWLDQNQRVISENVANADTPGYQPRALKQMDFKSFMGKSLGEGMSVEPAKMSATAPGHFGFAGSSDTAAKETRQKKVYEASPDNNGVILEEQLYNANLNKSNYEIATNLYRRNVGMLRMAVQGTGR